jgi:hypothetical protein
MIGEKFNWQDTFFRDLTLCVLDTLEGEIRWVNRFSSGDREVNVPFYYSLTGDERFLMDSFNDDIVNNNRFVDVNTDQIPRAHLTMTGFDIRSDEFSNPNVWLKMVVENNAEIRRVLAKIRAVPVTVKYDMHILLTSEIDIFKCNQAIMDTLWLYRFMYFEYNFLNIDAVMLIPDGTQVEIQREKNLTSENTMKITLSFEVQTYYPAFRKPSLGDLETGQFFGNYSWSNVNSTLSNRFYNDSVNPTQGEGSNLTGSPGGGTTGGGTTGGGTTGGGTNTTGNATYRGDILPFPRRTRWYGNLLELNGRSTQNSMNPGSDGNINSQS